MPGAYAKGAFRGMSLHTKKKPRKKIAYLNKKKKFERNIFAVRKDPAV